MLRWLLAYIFALASALNPALAALTVNQLNGFNAYTAADGGAEPSIVFNSCTEDTANLTTYTFNSVPIGTAQTGRFVVVAAVVEDSAGGFGITSATINGVAAADNGTTYGTASLNIAGDWFIGQVDTGTTTTITFTNSEAVTYMALCTWSLYGFSSPSFTEGLFLYAETNNGSAISTTFSGPVAGDLLMSWCYNAATLSPTQTWTADFTSSIPYAWYTDVAFAYGYIFPYVAQSTTVTCNWTGSSHGQLRSVLIRP
jgi:hypothetical protein